MRAWRVSSATSWTGLVLRGFQVWPGQNRDVRAQEPTGANGPTMREASWLVGGGGCLGALGAGDASQAPPSRAPSPPCSASRTVTLLNDHTPVLDPSLSKRGKGQEIRLSIWFSLVLVLPDLPSRGQAGAGRPRMDGAPGALPAPWLPAPLGGWAPPAPTPRPRWRSLFPAPAHPVLCLGGQRSSPGWSDVWGRECVVGPQGSAFREGMGGHTHRGSRDDSGELSPSGPGGRAALMCPRVSDPPPAHSHLGSTHARAPVAKLDPREALSDPLLVPPPGGRGLRSSHATVWWARFPGQVGGSSTQTDLASVGRRTGGAQGRGPSGLRVRPAWLSRLGTRKWAGFSAGWRWPVRAGPTRRS